MIIQSIGTLSTAENGDLIAPLIISKYQSQKSREEFAQVKLLIEQGKIIECELSEKRKKRSLDANAYFWVLCGKIADELRRTRETLSPEDVYRKYIRQIGGNYEIVPIKNEAVDTFCKAWSKNGVGWIYEDLGCSKINGYTNIKVYYGSSTYSTEIMARLIDEAIEDCKELHIEWLPPYKVKGYEFERS